MFVIHSYRYLKHGVYFPINDAIPVWIFNFQISELGLQKVNEWFASKRIPLLCAKDFESRLKKMCLSSLYTPTLYM